MCLVLGVLADWTSQEMGQVPADHWVPVYGQPKDFGGSPRAAFPTGWPGGGQERVFPKAPQCVRAGLEDGLHSQARSICQRGEEGGCVPLLAYSTLKDRPHV